MDFISNATAPRAAPEASGLAMDVNQFKSSIVTFLPLWAAVAFLLFMSYTPPVKKGVPGFTNVKTPFIGSYRFFSHKLTFWRDAVKGSKTGNFSFWLGKNHVVGLSGEAGRKLYLEHKDMDHIKGVVLIGHGPDYIDGRKTVQHGIWLPTMQGGKSWAQKRVIELLKTQQLTKRLPDVKRDCRDAFKAMGKTGIVNPARQCYNIVVLQATRIVATDELVDNPDLRAKLLHYMPILQCTSSCHLLSFPFLSYFSPSYWKRIYGRNGLWNTISPLVTKRMEYEAERKDDALQYFVDKGDSHEYITQFMTSMSFIAGANGCVLAGAMLYSIAHHPEYQNAIYEEMKAATASRVADPSKPFLEQLEDLTIEGWENMSPTLDMCYKECIRMWVAFPMGRMNEGKTDIVIPGTNEIIPAGGLASYNTIDCHFNEKLYPEPLKWDPARFGPGRLEMEQEAHGFMGWGAGRHPCNGIRWAKIQQNMIIAYALAMYKWSGCHADGSPNHEFIPPTTALNELAPALPQNLLLKAEPREE